MNLNHLKPAWKQFVCFNAMQPADQEEILSIIERADRQAITRLPGFTTNTIMFLMLAVSTVCCQGG